MYIYLRRPLLFLSSFFLLFVFRRGGGGTGARTWTRTRARTRAWAIFLYLGLGIRFKMSSQIFSKAAQADGSEEVDGKSGVNGIVSWQKLIKCLLKSWISQSIVQLDHAHILGQFLQRITLTLSKHQHDLYGYYYTAKTIIVCNWIAISSSIYLEKYLDENARWTRSLIFVEMNGTKDFPTDGICEEQMCENLGHISQLSDLKSVDSVICGNKYTLLIKKW